MSQQRIRPAAPGGFGAAGELLAIAVAFAVFLNSLGGEFVWDDRILILEGELPKAWNRLGEILTQDFFTRSEFDVVYGYYRPLTTFSYILDYSLWRLQPWGYHLTNVALHAGCAVLVVNLLRCLGWSTLAAGLAGVLFAAHPIHTESVAWIAGRTDLLAFFLTAVALRLELTEKRRAVALAPLAFALALLAKETAIVLLPWLVIVTVGMDRGGLAGAIRRLIPYLMVVVLYLVWRFVIIHVGGPSAPAIHTWRTVLLSLGPTLVRYLGWLALPLQQSAYVTNAYVTDLSDPRLWLSWLALLSLVAAGIALWRRYPDRRAMVALALLLAALLPNLNFIRPSSPLNMGATMAERFCYFPSFPFVALVALILAALWQHLRSGWLRFAALALTLVLIGTAARATVRRNRVWADEVTFLSETLATAPRAILLWGRLADYQLQRHDLAAGAEAIRRAEQIDPNAEHVLSAKAYLLVLQDKPGEAIPIQEDLVRRARKAIAPARNNLAYLYRISGRHAEALALLEEIVNQGRAYGDVYANLAEVHRAQGDPAGARTYYQRALEDRPDDLQVAAALVSLELAEGRPQAAEAVYRDALRYYPNDVRILNNVAMIRANGGDREGAVAMLRELVRQQPQYASARVNLAQLLYRGGDRRGAIQQLESARPMVRGTELEQVVAEQLSSWQSDSKENANASSPQ